MSRRRHIPDYLIDATNERRERTRKREKWVGNQLRSHYNTALGGYRADLATYMEDHFGEDDTAWDPVEAARLGSLDELTENLDEVLVDTGHGTEEFLDDVLTDSAKEGYDNALYLLALQGLDPDLIDPTLTDDEIVEWIEEQSIGGKNWTNRLTGWSSDTVTRYGSHLGGAIATGATVAATVSLFDRLAGQFTNRIVGLAGNELHHADMVGSDKLYTAAGTALATPGRTGMPVELGGKYAFDQVWLTQADKFVCRFCQSLHEIVTDLKPILNSHPNCRCYKVPLMQLLGQDPSVVSGFRIFQTDRQQARL